MPARTRNLVLAIAGTVAIPLSAFAIAATLLDGPDAVPATRSEVRIGEEAIPPGTVPGPVPDDPTTPVPEPASPPPPPAPAPAPAPAPVRPAPLEVIPPAPSSDDDDGDDDGDGDGDEGFDDDG